MLCPKEKSLRSKDNLEVHGGLLVMSSLCEEIASMPSDHLAKEQLEQRRLKASSSQVSFETTSNTNLQAFTNLRTLPQSLIQKFRNDLIVEASCLVIANSISKNAISASLPDQAQAKDVETGKAKVKSPLWWKTILDTALIIAPSPVKMPPPLDLKL